MKNNRIIALSFLAVSAVCGLASCGSKKPVGKPGVYFTASSYIITNTGNAANAQKSGKIKKTAYADKECAIVTVADEDKLEYGKQDVVITIEPQNFFTFRTYEVDTWVPNGLPARPYVGLGGPHALYDYPLQEGVAWTFEDQSTPHEVIIDPTTKEKAIFYTEKYVITVKKEFFQKNIVIDYGNVDTINNPVYVYNSERYNVLFEDLDTLAGDFKNLYTPDSDLSSFIVANKGAYISYRLKDSNAYTFNGFDEKVSPNDGEKQYYKHFSVKGINKENPDGVELAYYDSSVSDEEQQFMPTISDDKKVISFFIDWRLLAKGPEDGYAYVFDNFKVELKRPNTYCGDYEFITAGEGIKVYRGNNGSGFFQHTKEKADILYTKPSEDDSYTTVDSSNKDMKFEHLAIERDALTPGHQLDVPVQYSLVFVVENAKPENNDFFKVKVNSYEINLDLKYEDPQHITNGWRTDYYSGKGIEGETELPYWTFGDNNNWVLVQLNPEGRTAGLPSGIKQNGKNCYYLYTTSVGAVSGSYMNVAINSNPIPETVTFKTSDKVKEIGEFIKDEGSGIKRPCVGKNVVELQFGLKNPTANNAYSVVLDNDKYEATYVPMGNVATILIYTKDSTDTFSANDVITIKELKQQASVALTEDTKRLGYLKAQVYDVSVSSDVITLPVGSVKPSFIFGFDRIDSSYVFSSEDVVGKAIANEVSERKISVSLKGQELAFTATRIDDANIRIDVTTDVTLQAGDVIDLDIKFMKINIIEDGVSGCVTGINGLGTLYELVGQQSDTPITRTFDILTDGTAMFSGKGEFNVVYGDSGIVDTSGSKISQKDEKTLDATIIFNAKGGISNGVVINITVGFMPRKK